MNVFTIAGIVGILVIIVGVVVAALFVWLSRTVKENQVEMRAGQTATIESATLGYELPTGSDVPAQLAEARKLAARRAAALPRGANMRIGRLGATNLKTASQELEADPLSAVRIAAFHTWQGAKMGIPAGGVPEQQQAAVAQKPAAPAKKPEDLVPGVDYEFTEITDDMAAAEVRRARIANAKARSAAVKALKQQAPAAPAADQPAGQPVAAEAQKASPTAAAAAGISEPEYVEITDDMSPAEVRKARIANAKARSQYHKALKEAGIDPKAATAVKEQASAAPAATGASPKAAEPAAPTPATSREAITVPDDIPQPDYIEITDDMDAGEVRKARVHNAKARSQYYKALKERGIDPKELEEQQAAAASAAAEATEEAKEAAQAAETAEAAAEAGTGSVAIPDNVAPPDYIEITDDMPADEVRRARVENARERSRFFKDLKAAGIDPKTVDV